MQVSPLRDTTVISTPLKPHVTRCTLTARSGAFDRMRSSTIALACIACMPHYDQSCLADLDLHTCAAVGNTKEREAGRERGGARSKPAGEGAGIGNRLQEERERGDVKDAVGTTLGALAYCQFKLIPSWKHAESLPFVAPVSTLWIDICFPALIT